MRECEKLLASRLLDVVSKKTKIIAKSHHENQIWKLEVFLSPMLEEGMKHYMFGEVNEEEMIPKLCSKHAHADLLMFLLIANYFCPNAWRPIKKQKEVCVY